MRGFLRVLLLGVIALGLGWVALWWYAEGRLQAALLNGVAKVEAGGQVQISYDAVARGTSPLAASVTLVNPRWVQTLPDGGDVTLSTTGMGLRIDALNPLVMHADFGHVWQIVTPQAQGSVTWGQIEETAALNPAALFKAGVPAVLGYDFTAADIAVLASAGSFQVLHIDSITDHTSLNAAASAQQIAYSGVLDVRNIALAPLLTRMGNIPFGGKIAVLELSERVTGPVPADWQQRAAALRAAAAQPEKTRILVQAVHDWAAGGGSGNASLVLSLGPSTLNAAGSVAFDANVQPSGTASVTANHLDEFTAALTAAYPQLQTGIDNAETRLSPYLTTTAADGQLLSVQASYGKGGYVVNGTKVKDMAPLDWDALENPPPPPPPQAPGDGSGAAP